MARERADQGRAVVVVDLGGADAVREGERRRGPGARDGCDGKGGLLFGGGVLG